MTLEKVPPSEVRRSLLEDHARIRRLLGELEELAERVATGEDLGRRFPAVVGQLKRALADHNATEEAYLERALSAPLHERMVGEHRQEHAEMLAVLEAPDAATLARLLPRLCADLRAHMEREEQSFLTAEALGDHT